MPFFLSDMEMSETLDVNFEELASDLGMDDSNNEQLLNWLKEGATIPGANKLIERCSQCEWKGETKAKLLKKSFTKEEDSKLLKIAKTKKDWENIAKEFPGRTVHSIRNRWNRLKELTGGQPRSRKDWTEEEDLLIKQLYEEHGPKWRILKKSFSNRSDDAIRNRATRLKELGRL